MGVERHTLRPGKSGARPRMGDRVTMHYECRLVSSGKIVDSSKIKGRAAEFQVGTGRVIQGWDVGVMDMEEGEEAVLKVSSDYAYGTAGRPPAIPPNADLEFTVELLAINESMVQAAMRVKTETLALEQEEEMMRQAKAEQRAAAAASGTDVPLPGEQKQKREKDDKRKRKRSDRGGDDPPSGSSTSSSESSDSSEERRKQKKRSKDKRKKPKREKKSKSKSKKKKADKDGKHSRK